VEQRPDLLLLDIHMPAGEGFSVQERFRTISTQTAVPVIYLSGDRSGEVDKAVLKLGAFALVRKPFENDELLMMVKAALRKSAKSHGDEQACTLAGHA
jgi:DNA-binding response OmpR family regulator